MFIHTVYFWIKPGAPASARENLARDCRELLSKIPTVKHCWAGTAVPSARPVVDSSFAVGLTTVFEDAAGHDVYQPHPLHQEFIARNKEHWEKVVVYDVQG